MVFCVFGFFLKFVKLSSNSNLIAHMFAISLQVVHFITPFIHKGPLVIRFVHGRMSCDV